MALPLKVDRDWSPPKAQSLGELVRLLEVRAEELRGRGAEFAAELERNRIGMYTTEQEADDIAMELAARVGLRPDDVLDGYLEMMHALEHADPAEFARYDNGLSADQCAALYRAGFRAPAADGGLDDVYVPLGVLYDPHHAWCYRVFNLFREKQVHGYTTGPADFPPDDPPWAQVRAAAAAVGTSTSSPDAGGRARDAAVTDAAPTDAGSSSAGQVSDDPPSATPGAEGASSRGCSSAPRASGSLAALVPMLFAAVVRLVRDRGRRAARSRI
jgi:hypothetical protein